MMWLALVVRRTLDVYLKRPLTWDVALGIIVGILAYYGNTRLCFDTKDITSVQNSFAGTAISLAGFILTSLTIITTLRANLSYKGIEKSSNGLELILNSWAYKTIVGVFKVAILELVIVAIVLYATMLFNKIDSYLPFFVAVSSGALVAIAFTTLRCLYILFNLIDLEIKGREQASDPMPKPKKWRMQLEVLDKKKEKDSQFPKDFTLEMIEEEVERKFKPYNE